MMHRRAQSTKLAIIAGGVCLSTLLQSCKGKPEETQKEIQNGAYKIIIRTQEFHHSGTVNTEVCVSQSNNAQPLHEAQCFLRGYDFSDLAATWKSPTEIIIDFRCGRITHFTNDPIVETKGALPQGFYVYLNDICTLHDRVGDTKQ